MPPAIASFLRNDGIDATPHPIDRLSDHINCALGGNARAISASTLIGAGIDVINDHITWQICGIDRGRDPSDPSRHAVTSIRHGII